MTTIIKTGLESVPFHQRKILLYGKTKIGKTSLVANLSDSILFAAFEKRHADVQADVCQITEWDQFTALLEDKQTLSQYKMLALDTVDLAYIMYRQYFLKKSGYESEYDFPKRGEGWLGLRRGFRDVLFSLQRLSIGYFMIMHVSESETDTGKIITRPNYPYDNANEIRSVIEANVDAVWYMGATSVIKDGEPVTGREIRTEDNGTIEAGTGFKMPETISLPPDDIASSARKVIKAYQSMNKINSGGKK